MNTALKAWLALLSLSMFVANVDLLVTRAKAASPGAHQSTDYGAEDLDPLAELPIAAKLRVPLRRADQLQDARFVTADRLFLAYVFQGPVLVDTRGNRFLWRFDDVWAAPDQKSSKYDTYSYVTAYRDSVVVWSRGPKESRLSAIDLGTGKARWSVDFGNASPDGFLLVRDADALVSVLRDGRRVMLVALNPANGAKLWTQSVDSGDQARGGLPVIDGDSLLHPYGGIARVDARTGRTRWHKTDVRSDDRSPTMVLNGDALTVVDRTNTLRVLNSRTGAETFALALSPAALYSNISPGQDVIYLRGWLPGDEGKSRFLLAAHSAKDGKELWRYMDADPAVSNLIEEDGRLYFATWSSVIALDRQSGKSLFRAAASQVGRSYPVQIRKYAGLVAYVGELKIVGFHATTGAMVYSHGFDPMSPTAHMDALDESISHLQGYLNQFGTAGRAAAQGAGPGASLTGQAAYHFEQGRLSQERANSLWNDSYRHQWSGARSFDQSAAQRLRMESQIESSNAQMSYTFGAMVSLYDSAGRAFQVLTDLERAKLRPLLAERRRLYALQRSHSGGDYAFRPLRDGGYIGFSIVHLPSGRMIEKRLVREGRGLKYSDDAYGVYNVMGQQKGVVYFHEMRLAPDAETQHATGGKKKHVLYLIADRLPLEN